MPHGRLQADVSRNPVNWSRTLVTGNTNFTHSVELICTLIMNTNSAEEYGRIYWSGNRCNDRRHRVFKAILFCDEGVIYGNSTKPLHNRREIRKKKTGSPTFPQYLCYETNFVSTLNLKLNFIGWTCCGTRHLDGLLLHCVSWRWLQKEEIKTERMVKKEWIDTAEKYLLFYALY